VAISPASGIADPLFTTPSWTAVASQDSSSFGTSVANAGDVNGDGFDDVIVGAYRFDLPDGDVDGGAAYIYLGSACGPAGTPSWTSYGDSQAYARFGLPVASPGDVNGDGYDDIIVGATGPTIPRPTRVRRFCISARPPTRDGRGLVG
jgi:hypothetical protein